MSRFVLWGMTIFKRQIEKSTKDTEGNKMVREGKDIAPVIHGRLRVERISEWRKSTDSYPAES